MLALTPARWENSALLLAILWGAWRIWKQEGNKVSWQMHRWTSMCLLFIFAAFVVDAML
ncbi:MAG: hypothetical protein Fur0043_02960 [Anaerolineales bacterium]